MHPPMVVGVLLNYRDAERSESCIKSLLADGLDQVLLWDNSEDGGFSASSISERFSGNEQVHLHVCQANVGFAVGVNLAVEYCAREWPQAWVLLINNDACLHPGALARLTAELQSYPSAALAVPRIKQRVGVTGAVYYHRISGLLFQRPHSGCVAHPSGCCFLFVPRRLMLPLFDEDFFMYGEDCALGIRLAAGPEVRYLDEVLVSHEGTASSGLGSRFYEERMVAAHLLLVRKVSSSRVSLVLLTGVRLLMLSARAAIRSWRFHSLRPLQALWWGARLAWLDDALRTVAWRQAAEYRKPASPEHD